VTTRGPLFEGATEQEAARLLERARRRRFDAGEVVFHAGDPADTLHLIQSGRFAARVTTEFGGNLLTVAKEARITQSLASTVVAAEATLDQALAQVVLVGRATFRQPSGVLVLIAGTVDGPIRPVLDWRGALAAGAAIALVLGILRRSK